MICPNCKCEYVKGVTQCADCGVPLVAALDPSDQPLQDAEESVLVWEGSDPGEFAAVKAGLEEAGIPIVDQEAAGHLFFPTAPLKMDIYVSSEHVEDAKEVLLDLENKVDSDGLTGSGRESLEIPASDPTAGEEETELPPDVPEDWDANEPGTEIWAGSNRDLADTLAVCLREVGIGSRKLAAGGGWRLNVLPEHEVRAREVVREVVNASPPE
jgi:hypothetical protein